MNYIVFDLEFNQSYNSIEENKKCPFEIIQIGAVKLNKDLNIISTFNKFVKPELYTTINPYVEQITGITIDKVANSQSFEKIYNEFVYFLGEESILCVWGMSDIKELFRNIEYHKLHLSLIPKRYINIQLYASKHFNNQKGIYIGLSNAVKLLNIPIKNQFHDAFNDAYYTAEVFKKIYNKEIKTNIYNFNKYKNSTTHNTPKTRLDWDNLIKQFQKMFDREITLEEQSMIKLAYMMGKTNQFQIPHLNNSKDEGNKI
ncbi:3'-5' exonuclease [Clostridium tetanomorphum]|uniref:Exonuclease domain-containing protein n=1 Tax=Clostridium tetanomorphum TaxID=1553 RepID=A0A923ECX5_CLOTT|nr:3'-5' exonuclease [Clostridium tetanomorphum]MBC2399727.1 exonuclease domain-containing protein [Clostridium tetanomorphum]NRZ97946.1 DNA polymerase III epsilon subunit-like protein [Clostridium tetanomorphum]